MIITGRFKNSKLDPIKTYCNLTTADTTSYNNDTSDEALDDEEETMDICKGLWSRRTFKFTRKSSFFIAILNLSSATTDFADLAEPDYATMVNDLDCADVLGEVDIGDRSFFDLPQRYYLELCEQERHLRLRDSKSLWFM